jgi:class 3 adenylate cyclase
VLHEVVAAEGGAVVKTIGDAVMATFPAPDRALAAALRMREAMRRLNAERGGEDLVLKIGIHEGPCLAVTLNDRQDYFGQTVNIASRVQNLAEPQVILATRPVVEHPGAAAILTKNGVGSTTRRAALRGIGKEWQVCELHEATA